jgi:hypothetical protein
MPFSSILAAVFAGGIVATSKKTQALELLTTGSSITAAAAGAGVHRNTLSKWLRDPAYWAEYRAIVDRDLQVSGRRLSSNVDRAIDVLSAILDDETVPVSVKVRAADLVLSHTPKVLEFSDILQRIENLERQIG